MKSSSDFIHYQINNLVNLPKPIKTLIIVSVDTCAILFALLFSMYHLFRLHYVTISNVGLFFYIIAIVFTTLLIFNFLNLYKIITRYISPYSIVTSIFCSCVLSTAVVCIYTYLFQFRIPKLTYFIYFCLLLCLTTSARIMFKLLARYEKDKQNIIIYGAGSAGIQFLEAINNLENYRVVGFFDDNPALQNKIISGKKIYSTKKLKEKIIEYNVKSIILAIPSADKHTIKKIIAKLEEYPCQISSVPSLFDIIEGKLPILDIKPVQIEDLLGREIIPPKKELISKNIINKNVIVTGAGGSIGSELCRQIIKFSPKKLVLFEVSEFALFNINQELIKYCAENSITTKIMPTIGSIQNKTRLNNIVKKYHIQTFYHAAAYKHVPLVEYNMIEGIRNNIFGTKNCVEVSIDNNVDNFVLISTDKAVRPTNIMGATKRCAELILQAYSKEPNHNTTLCMVRFGNVLGSSGSVIPTFKKQIENGGPITITHQDITRYFMTIPEAAQLVIQAGAMGKGGEVFILDMGESVKIMDLAIQMIKLSGLSIKNEKNPDGDIEIQITGLRPGEKLYEELLIDNNTKPTEHTRIMQANEISIILSELEFIIEQLDQACKTKNFEKIREILCKAPLAFRPNSEIVDLLS